MRASSQALMVDVAAARGAGRQRLGRRHREWTLEGSSQPVWSLGLKPPTERAVLADVPSAQRWVQQWRDAGLPDGVSVEWQERTWRSVGAQLIPVKVTAETPEALAAWVGGPEAGEQRIFAHRCAVLRDRTVEWGAADAGLSVLRSHGSRLTRLSDADFSMVVDVVDWLLENPVSGLRPRQLPIRGVDSKWFGAHRTLLEVLVSHVRDETTTGGPMRVGDLGVVDSTRTVRLRILDPAMRPGGLRDVEVPLDQASEWSIAPAHVLIVENSETLLCLPDAVGSVAVWGRGFDTAAVHLPWLSAARLLYWGDLDSHGFAILHRYRTHLPELQSILMDVSTLEQFRDLWVPEPTPFRGALGTLTSAEARTLELLRASGDVRLEQERIPWSHALSVLSDWLPVVET